METAIKACGKARGESDRKLMKETKEFAKKRNDVKIRTRMGVLDHHM